MVKVSDLISEYNVSIETIRRDLEYLEKAGHLKRVYGGAVAHGLYGEEPEYAHREIINYEEKKAIGRKTAELINDGDTIFIEVGTTALEVALCLNDKHDLTVITNSMTIAHEMLRNDDCRVIMLGGVLRHGEMATSGSIAESNLRLFNANKLILGVGGISVAKGITDYNIPESGMRREMIKRSDTVIAVADYSKFDVVALNHICSIYDVDMLVVDWSVSPKKLADYRNLGLEVYIAPEPKAIV